MMKFAFALSIIALISACGPKARVSPKGPISVPQVDAKPVDQREPLVPEPSQEVEEPNIEEVPQDIPQRGQVNKTPIQLIPAHKPTEIEQAPQEPKSSSTTEALKNPYCANCHNGKSPKVPGTTQKTPVSRPSIPLPSHNPAQPQTPHTPVVTPPVATTPPTTEQRPPEPTTPETEVEQTPVTEPTVVIKAASDRIYSNSGKLGTGFRADNPYNALGLACMTGKAQTQDLNFPVRYRVESKIRTFQSGLRIHEVSISAVRIGQIMSLSNPARSESFKDLSQDGFRKACGDKYIQSVEMGCGMTFVFFYELKSPKENPEVFNLEVPEDQVNDAKREFARVKNVLERKKTTGELQGSLFALPSLNDEQKAAGVGPVFENLNKYIQASKAHECKKDQQAFLLAPFPL